MVVKIFAYVVPVAEYAWFTTDRCMAATQVWPLTE